MPNIKIEPTNTNLTLGLLLCELHSVTKILFRSQTALFAALFKSYCEYRGGTEYPGWIPSQGSINKLFLDKGALSWHQFNYYINNDDARLRKDVYRFIELATPTAKQRSILYAQILSLVEQCTNLDPEDKHYILAATPNKEVSELPDLLFRSLRMLMLYK